MEIHGFCDDRFLPLKEAFRANFDAGLELGASLALTHRGRRVVDLWGGHADAKRARPWQQDTIVNVFSTTKIMVSIATLMLIDRGLLDLDAPIARYWPEFAAGGKAAVTIRDALTHQAGVPGFDPPVPFAAMQDWSGITARIAAERHWFEGRRVVCYHALTYGFVLGELIRRVDGRHPGRFFREEIARKVGADFHIALTSKADLERIADLRDLNPPAFAEGLAAKVMNSVSPGNWTTWESVSADIPSGGGLGNGRSIAQVGAIVAMSGELDGVRFLSQNIIEQAAREQVYGEDPLMGWISLGLGFGLHSESFPAPTPTCIHWGGYGGSWGLMDPKTGVSFGYAPNNLIVDVADETLGLDPRLNRFSVALAKVLATLGTVSA